MWLDWQWNATLHMVYIDILWRLNKNMLFFLVPCFPHSRGGGYLFAWKGWVQLVALILQDIFQKIMCAPFFRFCLFEWGCSEVGYWGWENGSEGIKKWENKLEGIISRASLLNSPFNHKRESWSFWNHAFVPFTLLKTLASFKLKPVFVNTVSNPLQLCCGVFFI